LPVEGRPRGPTEVCFEELCVTTVKSSLAPQSAEQLVREYPGTACRLDFSEGDF